MACVHSGVLGSVPLAKVANTHQQVAEDDMRLVSAACSGISFGDASLVQRLKEMSVKSALHLY